MLKKQWVTYGTEAPVKNYPDRKCPQPFPQNLNVRQTENPRQVTVTVRVICPMFSLQVARMLYVSPKVNEFV